MVAGVGGRRDDARNTWSDVLWLARKEIRRTGWGYLYSAAYIAFFGALIAPRGDDGAGTWVVDVTFLFAVLIIAQPFFAREYFSWDNDRVAARLTFLRMLPIPLNVVVGSQMIRLVTAALFNAPAFFLPFYLLGEWDLDPGEFIGLAFFWTGMGAIGAGYGLCMEVSTSIKRYSITNLVLVAVLMPILSYLGVAHDIWLLHWSIGIAEEHPLLLAVVGLVVGTVAYLAIGRLARVLLAQRELLP